MERSIFTTPLRRAGDLKFVARRARLIASQLGVAAKQAKEFGEGVGEIAGDGLKRSAGASIRMVLAGSGADWRVEAVVSVPQIDRVPADTPPEIPAEIAASSDTVGVTGLVPPVGLGSDLASRPAEGEREIRLGLALPSPLPVSKEALTHWLAPLRLVRDSSALETALRHIGAMGGELAEAAGRARAMEAELETLRASHDTLSLLAVVASKTDSAVMVMDRHARVEWVNAGFVRLTGYLPAEVVGAHPFDSLHGAQTDPEAIRELAEAFGAAHGHSQELLHYRKDGETYWAALSITPVFDEDGVLSRWICIFSDITRRREAQAALERAREAAEAASRAKSEFLANMSHEIRTPMNAFIGMTELALLTELTAEQREYLGIAKESAESLLRLLNDILDLSKIEAGKIEIDYVEFDLPELIEDTMKALSVRATQKGLQLVWQPPQEVRRHVMGDPVRLRQVLINLVDNAIKFTEQGKITVSVEPQWQTDDEIGLQFSVADTGIGIPADELDRIFEGFTQGDSSTTRRFGGTGLGLTISSHLVQVMQGQMSVKSKPGRGSTFCFSLCFGIPPRRENADEQPETRPSCTAADLDSGDPPRILHVLVADDNAANRILAERILQKRGHRTNSAETGQEVLEALASQHFDVVLMDVQMPEMDGFATTAAIRRMERSPGKYTPVIAMTAYAMKGDRERCLAAGMDGYLAKPLRARELVALVESMTGEDPQSQASLLIAARNPESEAFASALARVEGDRQILKEQMEFFLRDGPVVLAEMAGAAGRQHREGLARAAHRLKGLAAGFDAIALVDCAGQLEETARKNDFRQAPQLCERVTREAEKLQHSIQVYLHTSE